MVLLLPTIGPLLADLDWHVIHTKENKSFVTADEPFILAPNRELGMYGGGIMTAGAVKAVPLNQNTYLVMRDLRPEAPESHTDATADVVRAVNLAVTANCERFVIGPAERLVRSLVKATAVDKTEPRSRVKVD
jgi:Protein of unknown function (DUF4238)